jgi:hypothetical protein
VDPEARPAAVVSTRRRRPAGIWVAAAVIVLLLAGLVAYLATRDQGGGTNASGSTAGSTAHSGSASSAASSSAGSSAPSTGAGATSGSSGNGNSGNGQLTASNIEGFLTDYHRLVLSDPHQAYTETGPTLRAAESESNYVNYWGQFSNVQLGNLQASDGSGKATATVTFTYQNGKTLTEQHTFTLLSRGNHLVLDSDYKTG